MDTLADEIEGNLKFLDKDSDKMVVLPTPQGLIKYSESGWPEKLYIDECVTYLIENLHLKTIIDNHKIMWYDNGVYRSGGDEIAKQALTKICFKIMTEDGESIIDKKIMDEIITKIIYLTSVKLEYFDNDINIINMANGLYNWQTGEFTKHSPDYLSLIQIPISFDKYAICPMIEIVMNDIVDKRYYTLCLEFIAYLLYRGYDIQKAILLYGPGATGKSWYLDLCKNFVGLQNCATESMQALSHDKFAAAGLFMKLLNECGDLDAENLRNTGTFKKLSSKDTLSVQKKFQDAFQFNNFAKMLFGTNIIPPTNDKTSGFIRRVIIIPFTRVFREDEYDEKRIVCNSDPKELSGLFNLVIPLLKPLLERMKFTNNPTNEEVARLYHSASNTIESFAEDRIYEDPISYINKEKMYETYVLYCKEHMSMPATRNAFSRDICRMANYIRGGSRNGKQNKRVPVWLNCNFV